MGCHSLLQGMFPTQGLNLGLLHCRQILYHLNHQGSPSSKAESICQKLEMVQDRPGSALPGTRNSRSGTYQAFSRYSIKFAEGINLISLGILKYILLLVEQMFSYILKKLVRGGRALILELKTYYTFQYWLCLSYP